MHAYNVCVQCRRPVCMLLLMLMPCASIPADIQAGQGLYFETITSTWRARNCDSSNSYGVSNKTHGLTPAPCKDCPQNMVASRDPSYPTSAKYFVQNADGTGGFNSVSACVLQPGVLLGDTAYGSLSLSKASIPHSSLAEILHAKAPACGGACNRLCRLT